jgi:hypothetical protein
MGPLCRIPGRLCTVGVPPPVSVQFLPLQKKSGSE